MKETVVTGLVITPDEVATTLKTLSTVEGFMQMVRNIIKQKESTESVQVDTINVHPKMMDILQACARIYDLLDRNWLN